MTSHLHAASHFVSRLSKQTQKPDAGAPFSDPALLTEELIGN